MKRYVTVLALALSGAVGEADQVEIPPNPVVRPNPVKTRATGASVDPGARLEPPPAPKTRYVTHVVLHESRLWTSTDGKPLEAKLIAFEDLVSGNAASQPAPPASPTVEKDGKIRLLAGGKPVAVALDRLSATDRELVTRIKQALARKAAKAE